MPVGDVKDEKIILQKRPIARIVAHIITLAIVLAIVTIQYFDSLGDMLFAERKVHLVEITDKVAEVIDSVGVSSWNQVSACRHMITHSGDINRAQELLELLKSTADFIDTENTIALAIDSDGNYYGSDGSTGYWMSSEMLFDSDTRRRQEIVEMPHISDDVFFLFIERLPEPVRIQEPERSITHVAIASKIDSLRDQMSVRGFGEKCYSYIINQDGRRLYDYTYAQNFIGGFNILNAIEVYPIIHGGTYDDLQNVFHGGENTALEFEYFDEETGSTENWFVANSAIQSTGWQVLLFVPTSVLGAHTNALMDQTIRFFMGLATILVFLFGTMVFVIMAGRSDKKLMIQQEKANAVLAAAVEEAQSANKAKSEFLSYMSHDIRTPINGIMGMTDIAIKRIDDKARVLDCLGKIQSSSHHLLNLINDVLTMSRIESGKTEVGHEPFDLRVCLANCASIIEGQLTAREVELIREFEEMEHPFVVGDELHLRQVFINILGNSVKFTPDGGKIYFRAEEICSGDGKAVFRFELEDTGIGMKPEFLPHLFDPFVQEDGGTRTNYKGTGLGMSITKKFMDLMGGTIQVESELNIGTRFVLELPLDVDSETKEAVKEPVADVDLNGMKILLVEDNELNLEIAKVLLEEQGVVVTTAENGRLAVELFEKNPAGTFDAILMDIMMPVMDGVSAARAIRGMERADAGTIPILAMTANAYDEDIRRTKEAGMNAHLSKPIDADTLLRTLHDFHTG